MNIVVNKSPIGVFLKESLPYLLLVALFFVCSDAMAQVGGFATEAKSMIDNVQKGIVIVVGAVACIALVWQLAQGFMGRKTWGDVFETSLWIFGAGAAVAAATWFFTSGQTISF
jgi:hypothetical protein